MFELQFLAEIPLTSSQPETRPPTPISKATLNCAVRTLDLNVRDFVVADFRRTASALLHEQGYNSDWVEKCTAPRSAVHGVYNRAEYLNQRQGGCFSLGGLC